MVLLSITDSSGRRGLPVAALLALDAGPITDLELRAFPPQRPPSSVMLIGHARYAEPLIAVVARCLSLPLPGARRGAGLLSFIGMSTSMRLQLSEGHGIHDAELRELLAIQVVGTRVRVTWQDDEHRRVVEAPRRGSYRNGGALLEHASRLAAWGADDVPRAPTALNQSVEIRAVRGVDVVREEDIPYHARNEFRKRGPRVLDSTCRAYFARDWLAFLQG